MHDEKKIEELEEKYAGLGFISLATPKEVRIKMKKFAKQYAEHISKPYKDALDSISSLPDMIHPTTIEDYQKLWRMVVKRINLINNQDE